MKKGSTRFALLSLILAATASIFASRKENSPEMRGVKTGSPDYIPRHTKFKGYMRDTRNWGRKRKAA